jgi:hypothetical protein
MIVPNSVLHLMVAVGFVFFARKVDTTEAS